MMFKLARSEEALMLGVGSALDSSLADVGRSAVREITIGAVRSGVDGTYLPYVFWALATKSSLPSLPSRQQEAFNLMLTVMRRTKTMPNYSSRFSVPDDLDVDTAINGLSRHLGSWAVRVMYPALLRAYQDALQSQVSKVVQLTNGRVKKGNEFDFLRIAFRKVVGIHSSMFRDGELLLRAIRVLPI